MEKVFGPKKFRRRLFEASVANEENNEDEQKKEEVEEEVGEEEEVKEEVLEEEIKVTKKRKRMEWHKEDVEIIKRFAKSHLSSKRFPRSAIIRRDIMALRDVEANDHKCKTTAVQINDHSLGLPDECGHLYIYIKVYLIVTEKPTIGSL